MKTVIQEAKRLYKKRNHKSYRSNIETLADTWQYPALDDYIQHIQTKGELHDCVSIEGVPFTMEEYDDIGKAVIYANLKLRLQINIVWENRYKDMKSVKEWHIYPATFFRTDISYLE